MKEVGNHQFERGENGVWTCKYCGTQAVDGHFAGLDNHACIYAREHLSDEE